MNTFKQRVRGIFTQNFHERLENPTRARCYITFCKISKQKCLDVMNIVNIHKYFWQSPNIPKFIDFVQNIGKS